MRIRAGFEISFYAQEKTPTALLLSVHPSRRGDLIRPDRLQASPEVVIRQHLDSFGNRPKHTFFYPLEDYDPSTLDRLAALGRQGFGDVEVHYHHDNDTSSQMAAALENFKTALHDRHGLLRREGPDNDIVYCFIHGNWALDNSRPDGRWCGVNDELSVLVKTGCRMDLTMPSAPSDTQTAKINSIYFARGRPGRAKSHNTGRDVGIGQWGSPDELLLIQGPLGLNWRSRKIGLLPRIENGEISADAPPARSRVRLWARLAPMLQSGEQHIFIKLHTHGAPAAIRSSLLNGNMEKLWSLLEDEYRDQPGRRLRYVSAWEMYCIIRDLAQSGATGPHQS